MNSTCPNIITLCELQCSFHWCWLIEKIVEWKESFQPESSSEWEKQCLCFKWRGIFFYFFSFFLLFSCVCFVYLRSQRILKVTPLVWKRNPQEQVIVNAFAIFIFSAQFNSGTEQSEKPKTPKFISKSLLTPLVWLYNHLKQVKIPHHLSIFTAARVKRTLVKV